MKNLIRRAVQFLTALAINSFYTGFVQGSVYKGSLKNVCIPVLNCSYCPGAWGSCPLAVLQTGIAGVTSFKSIFFVSGLLFLLGLMLGRFICGWFCPFGWLQELLYRIPSPKIFLKGKLLALENLKYIILIIFVFLLPTLASYGVSGTAFCRYICPVEILEARIPIMIARPSLASTISGFFAWKSVLLIALLFLSVFLIKPFCRFLCPLGAIYSLFNNVSLFRFQVDSNKCTVCSKCQKQCSLGIPVYVKPNHRECIRCMECLPCPEEALNIKSCSKNNSAEIETS